MIRVLVVEDHRALAEGLAALLASEPGIEVIRVVHTRAAAEEQILTERPDIVVTDLRLGPGEDGRELIRDLNHLTTFIMYSAFDQRTHRERALADGAAAFVSKTATFEELLDAIRTAAGPGGT